MKYKAGQKKAHNKIRHSYYKGLPFYNVNGKHRFSKYYKHEEHLEHRGNRTGKLI